MSARWLQIDRRNSIFYDYLLAGAGAAGAGGGAGCAGAAPVVTPGLALVRGVTSRMPGGVAGGELGAGAFWAVEEVPALCTDELFKP
jgi:hypothetical protein